MDISTIGSTAKVYPTQSISGVSTPASSDSDGDNDSSRIAGTGGRRTHGGGAFMQDAIQALQSLGLNFPGVSGNASPANSASPAGSTNTNNQSLSAPSSNISQALHTFLHDLHQAVNQSGAAQQQPSVSAATDSDGDNDSSSWSSAGKQNGYGNFATNLQNLISSLSNGSANSSASGGNGSTLQTDFSNLVNALGGSSSSSTSMPTLQDFLNKLSNNANNTNSSQNAVGSIVSTVV